MGLCAGVWSGTWHVTPFLGAAFKSDATETIATFGGAVGRAVTTHLGLEAEVAVIPDILTVWVISKPHC